MTFDHFQAQILDRFQNLHDEIARSHPSLINGKVRCGRCGQLRIVDSARCLRHGWPKCCSVTMELQPAPEATT